MGHQVAAIELTTGQVQSFFRKKDEFLGPSGWEFVLTPGPKRPVDVRFSPDGRALYVADIGALTARAGGAGPFRAPSPAQARSGGSRGMTASR